MIIGRRMLNTPPAHFTIRWKLLSRYDPFHSSKQPQLTFTQVHPKKALYNALLILYGVEIDILQHETRRSYDFSPT